MRLLEDFFNDIDDIKVNDETVQTSEPQQKENEDFAARFVISYKYKKEQFKALDYKTDYIIFKRICYIFTKSDFTSDDFNIDATLWTMDKNDWGKNSYPITETLAHEKELISTLKKIHKAKTPAIEITYRIYCDIPKTSYNTYARNLLKLSTTLSKMLSHYNVRKITLKPVYNSNGIVDFNLTDHQDPYSSDFAQSYQILFDEKPDVDSVIKKQYKNGQGQHLFTYMLNLEQRQPLKDYHISIYGFQMQTSSANTEIFIELKPQLTGSNESGSIVQFVKRYFVNAMDNSDIEYICIYNNSGNIHFKVFVDSSVVELTTIPGTQKKTSTSGHLVKYGSLPYESNSDYIISLIDKDTRAYIMDDGRLQGECVFDSEFENIKQKWEKFKKRHNENF